MGILREANVGATVTFDEARPVDKCVDEIARLVYNVAQYGSLSQELNLTAFAEYSAEAMARRLARAFDAVLGNNKKSNR